MAKDNKNVLLIAQEIKLAKILAGNNSKLRERTLKRLGKWLNDRTENAPVSEDVFMRIWKGLFYSMWMSDKPLAQEQCAESIAKLVHFNDTKISLLFFKCFLQTMVNEWFGIDHHRIDKFLMLVRRVLRQTFEVLKNADWSNEDINNFREILNKTALKIDKSTALSLVLHIDEIFLEELAKVSHGKIAANKVLELIQPFAQQLARLDDIRHAKHVSQHIFKYLMNQSDVGIEYKEKFHAWRVQGFPGGTMDSLEKVEIENDGDENNPENYSSDEEYFGNQPKDPRAGKIDVVLPQLQFDANEMSNLLNDLRFKKYTSSLGRKQLSTLTDKFKQLAEGVYPLGSTKVATVPEDGYNTDLKSSVQRLEKFEKKLQSGAETKKAKQRRLKQQKVKEMLAEQLEQLTALKNENKIEKKQNKINKKQNLKKSSIDSEVHSEKHSEISPEKTNKTKSKIELKKPKVPVKKFEENSDVFLKFVQKSEAKLMEQFRKQSVNPKKRKNSDDGLELMNPNKKSKKLKNYVTRNDLRNSKEPEIPTKNANTFIRNSGMWTVEEFDIPDESTKKTRLQTLKSATKPLKSPTKSLKKSPKPDKTDDWSKPLQNGETEYFVVSKKTKNKLKRLNENKKGPLKKISPDLQTPKSLKKNKKSVIVKNPFYSKENTPKSQKKIQFSDNNQAQDFAEHLQQILSSPGIPYDSKKKPVKPLLKPSPIPSPINPFYKRKL